MADVEEIRMPEGSIIGGPGSLLSLVFGVLNLPLGATGESFQVAIPGYVWGKMFIILTLRFPKLGR